MTDERGITALEIFIALTLIGLVTLLVLPRLEGYMILRDLEHTARLLGADVRLTQQYAVTQDEPFWLALVGAQYSLQRVGDGTVVKVVDVPATVTVTTTFPSNRLEVTATGAPVQSGEFCLTTGTAALKIDVRPATGRTEIREVASCP